MEPLPVDSPPPTLYQYTKWDGLEGIAKSGQLWVTHFDCLNDRDEVEYATRLLGDLARGVPSEECARNAIDDLGRLRYACVASLSEEGDLLSQWRAYGGHGHGFSIGINGPELRLILERERQSEEGWRLKRVIYDPDQQITMICNVIQSAPREGHRAEGHCSGCAHYSKELETLALSLKAPNWREEREWRLALLSDAPPPKTRKGGPSRAAYDVFPRERNAILPGETATQNPSLPREANRILLDRIIVGPKHNDNRRGWEATVRALMRESDPPARLSPSFDVRPSQATLR